MLEPIDYERALRDLQAKKRRRRVERVFRRLIDPRPSSPGQVLAVGAALTLVGWLFAPLHVIVLAGLALLVLGFLSGLIQPRSRTVVWRRRNVEVPAEVSWKSRLYYVLYRKAGR